MAGLRRVGPGTAPSYHRRYPQLQRHLERAISTPDEHYSTRRSTLAAEAATITRRATLYGLGAASFAAFSLILIYLSLHTNTSRWIILPLLLAALFCLNRYLHSRRRHDQFLRLMVLYDQAIARVDGTQPQSSHTGETLRPANHLYDRDLAILGPDSLFGLLATVRTGVGQRGLAHDLLYPPAPEETSARQQAIQELAPRHDLREQIHLLGVSQFQQVAANFFDDWLADPPPVFHPAIRFILLITSGLFLGLLLAGIFHIAPWLNVNPNLLAVLALQSAFGLYLRRRVLPILKAATNLANQMQIFRDGLALLQANTFTSPRLLNLQQLSRTPDDAVAAIKRIQSQFVIVEQRTKEWFLIASLLLSAGSHAAISIAKWKRRYAAPMQQWLSIWGEFETLNALATYAYEHPENTYPELLPAGTAIFEATALAHPLLPPSAVTNDIAFNPANRLYLISGSNMAGKSTLLRSIGLNAILAANGAPIRATSARISPFAIGASIALSDSLAEGKSKFLAEVERLHAILLLAAGPTPVLFLIDEIFSGTNSLDRRIAAEAVARSLIAAHAVGALSTHDLTLTEMVAEPSLCALNLHMASPNPSDPLAFDYRLKPGVNPTSNALAILRLIGIETNPLPPAEDAT